MLSMIEKEEQHYLTSMTKLGSLFTTVTIHNQGSCLRMHIIDWAASDDGSINDVTSSLEADFDVLHQVIHYIPHCGYRAMYAMDA